MSTQNGLLRIAHAVRTLGYGIGGLFALGGAAMAVKETRWDGDGVLIVGSMFVIAALCAGVGHGLAWIVEGFAD